MRQISQNYKTGDITIESVAPPALRPGGVLVRSAFSVVSVGTESMKVREGKMNLLDKARARPDQVKKVIQSVQQQGLAATYRKVSNKLDTLTPLGYSAAGIVEAVGREATEFVVGQRVAVAGAGYANHAEINFVPKNLVVPVPDGVSLEHAAFTTVGAIALQSFRQSDLTLGETACVIGLGLLGQILVQILNAAGVRSVGIDLSAERCALALELGADAAGLPDDPQVRAALMRLTRGRGADCIIIAAGGSSNAALDTAISLSRDRARIVSLGKTGLDLPWKECFEKDLDVRFSRSYGPGRYDPSYEEKGVDYPIGYVRWTERRNMEAFLDLVASGDVKLDPIASGTYPFGEAEDVYARLAEGGGNTLGILFRYDDAPPSGETPRPAPARAPQSAKKTDVVRLGVIGAGNYASSMLLPHLAKRSDVRMAHVVTSTGLSTANAVRKFGFDRTGTSVDELLQRDDVDAILIATRHASHADLTARAIRAGKAVFVEKPLSIDLEGLELVNTAIRETGNDRLQVGFNRRFSPMVKALAAHFSGPRTPLVMTYRVHAGAMDAGSWYNDVSEGSRFAGEAGHFFDVMSYLTGASPESVVARRIAPRTADDQENITAVVSYADGSVGTLLYLTQGGAKVPKELVEVFGGGKTGQLDNFRAVHLFQGTKQKTEKPGVSDKGQEAELEAFVTAVRRGLPMPISLASLDETTRVTLAAEESIRLDQPVVLSRSRD